MKTLLAFAVAFGLPAIVWAEEPAQATTQTVTTETKAAKPASPDRFVMASGSVLAMRGAEGERLTNDVKLIDGTIVTTGGTIRRPDGAEAVLADGQFISMSGKLGPMPAAAPGPASVTETIRVVKP